MALDAQLALLLNGLAGQSPLLDGIIVFFASYLAYILVAVFLAFLLYSSYVRREKLEILVVTAISVVVARGVITELIRFFYHRPRPFSELPEMRQLIDTTSWSFPSGHATFFFAMATAVYLYNKKWGIGFFIAAVLIAVSRVIAGIHYPSDVIGGALIGIGVGLATFHIARKAVPQEQNQTY